MSCTDDNNFTIGNTHVRHSLMRVLLDDLAANELHNANNDDEDQNSDVGNVQHVAVVAVTDGEVAQTAGTDDTGHCGQVQQLIAVMVVPRAMAATLSFRYTRKMISSGGGAHRERRFDQTRIKFCRVHSPPDG